MFGVVQKSALLLAGIFTLTFSHGAHAVPSNDNLANASTLLGATDTGTNVDATAEIDENDHAAHPSFVSVWWAWTAPATGTYRLNTAGSDFDTLLAVYTGTGFPLNEVASNDDGPVDTTSQLNFSATASTTYYIAVDGFGGATGNIVLNMEEVVLASNDDLAEAVFISDLPFTQTTSTLLATKELAEPDHNGNVGGASIWYSWYASTTQTVMIDTIGSDYDTLLAVYTGTEYPLTEVASDDQSGGDDTSLLTFNAEAGTTYTIVIDGYFGDRGLATLNMNVASSPANDALANAVEISGFVVQTTGSNVLATKEIGEPDHAEDIGGRSVWWYWTAPGNGEVILTTVGSSFDTLLAVYEGSDYPLTLVAEDDNSGCGCGGSLLYFTATAGTTYRIAVDGYQGAQGNVLLSLVAFPVHVVDITRLNSDPTNAGIVQFGVQFSENVTGVDISDFTTSSSGSISGASIINVIGSGDFYVVSVSSGTGDGDLQLVLVDDNSIIDTPLNMLGGPDLEDGNYENEYYDIDKTRPVVDSITAVDEVTVDLVFADDHDMGAGVLDPANYSISGPGKGSVANNPASVAHQSGNTYRLSWSSGSMINGQNVTITALNVFDEPGNEIGPSNTGTNTALPVSLTGFTIE